MLSKNLRDSATTQSDVNRKRFLVLAVAVIHSGSDGRDKGGVPL